jgi:D-arabinose 1-dehydrogenase-like Zn-dependent alcohol dehydrogenase
MKAARIHEYGKPVVLADVPVPDIQPDEVLVRVKACGMCRSDAQLIDGYFRPFADIPTPITIGYEISGVVHRIGKAVPKVGLVGSRMDVPLLPRVNREQTFHGSYWGNNIDLMEVLSLAAEGKIRHTTSQFKFEQVNEYLDRMRTGEIIGRAVMTF